MNDRWEDEYDTFKREKNCMTCQFAKDFAPVLTSDLCHQCRRGSNYEPTQKPSFQVTSAKDLVAKGSYIDQELSETEIKEELVWHDKPLCTRIDGKQVHCDAYTHGRCDGDLTCEEAEKVLFNEAAELDGVELEEYEPGVRTAAARFNDAHEMLEDSSLVPSDVLPDSGKRREFSTGSVRDVRVNKGRYDLMSPIAILRYARRMEDGATKYGLRNWEKGQDVMSSLDSGIRHIFEYIWECMTDTKLTEDHLGAALWNISAAIHTIEMIHLGKLSDELDDVPGGMQRWTDEEPKTESS